MERPPRANRQSSATAAPSSSDSSSARSPIWRRGQTEPPRIGHNERGRRTNTTRVMLRKTLSRTISPQAGTGGQRERRAHRVDEPPPRGPRSDGAKRWPARHQNSHNAPVSAKLRPATGLPPWALFVRALPAGTRDRTSASRNAGAHRGAPTRTCSAHGSNGPTTHGARGSPPCHASEDTCGSITGHA